MARFTENAWDNIYQKQLLTVMIQRRETHILELVKRRIRRVKGSMMFTLLNFQIHEEADQLKELRNQLNNL